ncbi:hypothetical protein BDB00DRAFT_875314 [Zychaea mexicana]|uniref:uncharacterized protein n=1 Tax=Zychaea mexicana TaxID=64656 RepID=UPI0022FE8DDA|nr:uncharacterized protein BDB00DRAFT_875314 [Zychaea mexicana]KAI9490415.1 hypothetical protein BDB00DRAFT_875314 [Zychaea mexicana]
MALNLTDFVMRPNPGIAGALVSVRSNFFRVQSFLRGNVYHYHIEIADMANKSSNIPPALNRRVWKAFESTGGQGILNGSRAIYDGRKNVFTAMPLRTLTAHEASQFEVELPQEGAAATGPRTSSTQPSSGIFKVKIKKAGEIKMEELHRFLQGTSSLTTNCLTAVMALDVLIRYLPSMKYNTVVGRSFYTPVGSQSLHGGLEVWQGYFQTSRPGVGSMYINADVSAAVFREGGPLLEVVAKIIGRQSIDELRHYGLTPAPADRTFFKDQDNNEMSVAQYFTAHYNMGLRFPFLPCIIVRKTIFLPMEVCDIVPGQRYNKKLDEQQTAEMITFTCQKPDVRANKIKQGFTLLETNNPYMQQSGFKVEPEMFIVKNCFKEALRVDVKCYDALVALTEKNMLEEKAEWDFISTLPYEEHYGLSDADFFRSRYMIQLKRYSHKEDMQQAQKEAENDFGLKKSLNVMHSKARTLLAECKYEECLSLKMKVELYILTQELVDRLKDEAVTWHAAGMYNLYIEKYSEARRHFSRATDIDQYFEDS